jgi:hypothetical protein
MSRRRERVSAQGLLPLMEARPWKDGKTVTYRYHPIGGKPINLGTNREAAIEEVLRLNKAAPESGTLAEMWRLYQRTSDWKDLKDGTRTDYTLCWTQLEPRFGKMAPAAIKALHVRRYLRVERAESPVRANREMALLSNLLNVAIDQGECELNVCRHVRRNKERPRKLAPAPETLQRFVAWAWARGGQAAVLSGMAEFAARSGNRRIEFRPLRWPQWTQESVRLQRAKQRDDDAPVFEVVGNSHELLELRQRMHALSGKDPAGPVFPSARGGPYNERAFKSAWARLMADAMDASAGPPVLVDGQRFTFHDLRAFYTTEHKRIHGGLPDLHKNPETTARVYDRSKEVRRRAI